MLFPAFQVRWKTIFVINIKVYKYVHRNKKVETLAKSVWVSQCAQPKKCSHKRRATNFSHLQKLENGNRLYEDHEYKATQWKRGSSTFLFHFFFLFSDHWNWVKSSHPVVVVVAKNTNIIPKSSSTFIYSQKPPQPKTSLAKEIIL